MGGDESPRCGPLKLSVSIHAPAWGATCFDQQTGFGDVFQSTPPRGGRPMRGDGLHGRRCFNPRPRVGGDTRYRLPKCKHGFQSTPPRGGRRGVEVITHYELVSIHAPAWGATLRTLDQQVNYLFQSTPPRGGRPLAYTATWASSCFNPRPRVGGDIRRGRNPRASGCFNPRPRVGGDLKPIGQTARNACFNPRPRVGGDLDLKGALRPSTVSIHAPAWGATQR